MEQKIESLYAILSTSQTSKAFPDPLAISHDSPPTHEPASHVQLTPSYHSAPAERHVSHHFPVFSLPLSSFDDIRDVISRGIVNFDKAQEFLELYRLKVATFPFVVVGPSVSLESLRRERPFLLLAILAYGAQDDSELQRVLETEIRETCSKRCIVNGEKSMDLLQGLLVYLAW